MLRSPIMYSKILLISGVTLAIVVSFLGTSIANADEQFASKFEKFLQQDKTQSIDELPQTVDDAVSFYYNGNNYQPVWFYDFDQAEPQINEYRNIIIEHAFANGMPTEKYDLNSVTAEKKTTI